MKQFKFLLKYNQVFEATQKEKDEKKAYINAIYDELLESPAMNDIVALKTDFSEMTGGVPFNEKNSRIHPTRSYYVLVDEGKFKINFKRNFTSNTATIIVKFEDGRPVEYIFETHERTASFAGSDEEQREAAESFFRKMNIEESKNKYPSLRIPTDSTTGQQIEKLNDLIKLAEKWNQIYNANIDTKVGDPIELKKRLYDFMEKYNEDMEKVRAEKFAEGEKKMVSYGKDFPVKMIFDDLEKCLRWVWAYFVARKTPRTLDPAKTFDYLMKNEYLWKQKLPLGYRYGSKIDIEDFLNGELNKKEIIEELKFRGGGIKSLVASELKDIKRTTQFLKQVFKVLGLEFISETEGSFSSKVVSRGAAPLSEIPKRELTSGTTKEEIGSNWIIGFEISKVLSSKNTILGLAAKNMTKNQINFTNRDLVFQLSQRPEFTKVGKEKIHTEISGDKVIIFFEARTEQEALLQLLTGYSFKTQSGEKITYGPWLLKAFTETNNVTINGEEVEADTFLDIIRNFITLLGKNLTNFIPNSKNNPYFLLTNIPTDISETDPRILKLISQVINNNLTLKKKLQQKNNELYNLLTQNGLTPVDISTKVKGKRAI